MNLAQLADAAQFLKRSQGGTMSLLIYGPPRTGKTKLAISIARIPEVTSVDVFDLENGSDTIITAAREGYFNEEERKKINIFKVTDMPEHPVAMETILKCIVEPKERKLCALHSRVDCATCKKDTTAQWFTFDLTKKKNTDWVIIDTGSQFGTSCHNYATRGMSYDTKPSFDEWGMQSRMIEDFRCVMQAAPYCNFIVICHELMLDKDDGEVKNQLASPAKVQDVMGKIYPLCGSRASSIRFGGAFGTVIYMEKKVRQHAAGSSSTYKSDVITGSRIGMKIEDVEGGINPDLRNAFSIAGLTAWKPAVPFNTKK